MIKYLEGNCIDKMKELEDNSIDCVVSSPPYFGLRDYGTAQWQGGDPNCDHSINDKGIDSKKNKLIERPAQHFNWSKCIKCGAKRVIMVNMVELYQKHILVI